LVVHVGHLGYLMVQFVDLVGELLVLTLVFGLRSSCGDNMLFCLMRLQLHLLSPGGIIHLGCNPWSISTIFSIVGSNLAWWRYTSNSFGL
jgi:hypothetical protein